MDPRLRALNRFGLGARPGEPDHVGDARGWLRQQLDGAPPVIPAPEVASPTAIAKAIRAFQMARQTDTDQRREPRQRLQEIAQTEARTALRQRVTTERPFVERLVAFWSNHFCISTAGKIQVVPLAGAYEREAIRPHVLGRFEDMVLASAKHPAMLTYLDNFQSIGPSSPGARTVQRANGQRRGLNENYARELLELHTLGVNGGYSQQDVLELARILTGWTIDNGAGPGRRAQRPRAVLGRGGAMGFIFREALHEPGTKTLLGVRYGQAGIGEGERAIHDLCRHPSTAKFIATKLVTHFVADNSPAAAVDRIARVFQSSEGDLKLVARALVDEPEAWKDEHRKFRSPQDWLVATFRALGATDPRERLVATLRQLRQPLWSPSSPKGFSDVTTDWADPDSLLNRAELARTIGQQPEARAVDPRSIVSLVDIAARDPLHTLVTDTSIPAGERLALAIAGPAFQWR